MIDIPQRSMSFVTMEGEIVDIPNQALQLLYAIIIIYSMGGYL